MRHGTVLRPPRRALAVTASLSLAAAFLMPATAAYAQTPTAPPGCEITTDTTTTTTTMNCVNGLSNNVSFTDDNNLVVTITNTTAGAPGIDAMLTKSGSGTVNIQVTGGPGVGTGVLGGTGVTGGIDTTGATGDVNITVTGGAAASPDSAGGGTGLTGRIDAGAQSSQNPFGPGTGTGVVSVTVTGGNGVGATPGGTGMDSASLASIWNAGAAGSTTRIVGGAGGSGSSNGGQGGAGVEGHIRVLGVPAAIVGGAGGEGSTYGGFGGVGAQYALEGPLYVADVTGGAGGNGGVGGAMGGAAMRAGVPAYASSATTVTGGAGGNTNPSSPEAYGGTGGTALEDNATLQGIGDVSDLITIAGGVSGRPRSLTYKIGIASGAKVIGGRGDGNTITVDRNDGTVDGGSGSGNTCVIADNRGTVTHCTLA